MYRKLKSLSSIFIFRQRKRMKKQIGFGTSLNNNFVDEDDHAMALSEEVRDFDQILVGYKKKRQTLITIDENQYNFVCVACYSIPTYSENIISIFLKNPMLICINRLNRWLLRQPATGNTEIISFKLKSISSRDRYPPIDALVIFFFLFLDS